MSHDVPAPRGEESAASAAVVATSADAADVSPPADDAAGIRHLSVRAYLGIVLGYLGVLIVATLFTLDRDLGSPDFTETGDVVRQLDVRMAVMLLYVYGLIAALGWWRPVFVDDRPVRRWVWIVPAAMGLTIVGCTNYTGLGEKSLGFAVALLVGTLAIGFAEEGLFRGIGVTTFRINGYSEGKVALWTSVLFALAHSASLLGGPLQIVSTLAGGYLYYLVRRVSGGLLLAAAVHGLWDFGLYSAEVVDGTVYGLAPMFLVVEVVLVVALIVARRRIEPRAATA